VKKYAIWLVAAAVLGASPGVYGGERQQAATKPSAAASSEATQSALATVTFQFDRNGLPVPRYTLVVREDGSGTYHAEEVERRSADSALQQVTAKQIDRPMTLSAETTAKILQTARSLNLFNMSCGTKLKNIADTGKKTLSYAGAEGTGTCAYNYSDDKNVTMLTELFYGIAYTMDVGRRLDFERRFDRLGLDAELLSLEHAVESKDALELGNIAPTLRTIAGDGEVMQRVRVRAGKLLDQSTGGK
jgi:hypothetical protein